MGDHKNEENRLEAFINDFLSDEEADEGSSKIYNGSDIDEISSDSDSDSSVPAKRVKVSDGDGTKAITPTTAANSVEQTIDNVARNLHGSCGSSLHKNDDDTKHFQGLDSDFVIKKRVVEFMREKQPVDFFYMFVDEDVINLMVVETNRYAAQKLKKTKKISTRWKETYPSEMKRFLGLQIWFGLVQMPKIECYWSDDVLYSTDVKQVMSRNRFELLLSNWHFTDNRCENTCESLYKIRPLINLVREKFQEIVTPSSNICLDEILVPFRSRLTFRQYVENRGHKFEIKLFKLCIEDGYTYNLKLNCLVGKINITESIQTLIAMELCENLLDSGRTIYVHNCYTSIELAHKLLSRQTHLVGILNKIGEGKPQDATQKELKIRMESETGVILIKWCDEHEALMLLTKHASKMESPTDLNEVENLKANHSKSRSFVDLSNQVKAYAYCLQGMKWYRKVAAEILLGYAIVNAFIVYKRVTNKKISITEFRERIAKGLLGLSHHINNKVKSNSDQEKHILEEIGNQIRRRCVGCYEKLAKEYNRKYATFKSKLSRWKCVQCQKFYCVPCFTVAHNYTL